MSPDAANALAMAFAKPAPAMVAAPIILGIDPGSKDWTSVAAVKYHDGMMTVLAVEHVKDIGTGLEGLINKLHRQVSRPRGFSQSHWRKIWKLKYPSGAPRT